MDVQRSLCGPTTFVGELLEAQLVRPYLDALDRASVVAHTDHDGLHFAKSRVTHDGDAVAGAVAVEVAEFLIEAGVAEALLAVAILLERCELGKVYVEHVLGRPYGSAVVGAVGVVEREALRCQRQRNLVFVVVALIVRAQTDEDRCLAVAQVRDVVGQGIGVNEHLQVLVLSHVVVTVLEYGTCVAR